MFSFMPDHGSNLLALCRRSWTPCTRFCTSFATLPRVLDRLENERAGLTDLPVQGALQICVALIRLD